MRFALVFFVLLATACSKSPTAPSLPGASTGPNGGTWTGTLRDDANGQGDVRLVLQDTLLNGASVLTGTWTTSYADSTKNANGDVSGGVTGTLVFLTLRRLTALSCTNGAPAPVLNGSYVSLNLTLSGRTISGAYTYQGCGGSSAGTLTLTRS